MHHLLVRCLAMLKVFLVDTLPSLASMTANVVNSLDMLGYNASKVIQEEITHRSAFNVNSTCPAHEHTVFHNDPIWGSLGIALIFIPGIPATIYGIIIYFQEYKQFDPIKFLAGVLTFFCYPVTHIFLHIKAIFRPNNPDDKRNLLLGITFQAFFESCPQLTLQGFSLINNTHARSGQLITMALCLFVLIKTVVQFDLVLRNCTSWKKVLHHIFAVLPLYMISCVFRVGSLVIIAAFWRQWSIIAIILIPLEFLIIARLLYFDWSNSFIIGLSNIGVMSLGYDALSAGVGTVETQPSHMTWYNNKSLKFAKISSLVSCLHLTACLTILLLHVNATPDYLDHWNNLVLHPTDCCKYSFNTVLGIFIGLGVVHLLLMRYSVLDVGANSMARGKSQKKYNQQESY